MNFTSPRICIKEQEYHHIVVIQSLQYLTSDGKSTLEEIEPKDKLGVGERWDEIVASNKTTLFNDAEITESGTWKQNKLGYM